MNNQNNQIPVNNNLQNNNQAPLNNMQYNNTVNNNAANTNQPTKEQQDNNLLQDLESSRKKAVKNSIIGGIIGGIVAVAGIVLLRGDSISFAIILGIIIAGGISAKSKKEFTAKYKKGIVGDCFNQVFSNVKYMPETGISEQEIRESQLIVSSDEYTSEDYVSGSYKNVNFISSDIHVVEVSTDSEGHTTRTTIFLGQWYVFDFNKNFKGSLRVLEKTYRHTKRASLFASKKEKEFYKGIELEDESFNKKFNVQAEIPVEAFYILTPPTIEKINKLNDNVKGDILLGFNNNKLTVALNSNKDNFNHSIFKKIDLVADREQALSEMKTIADFIDTLSLDNTLFK